MRNWRDVQVGDTVLYTGAFISLSWDLTGKFGIVKKLTNYTNEGSLVREKEELVIDVLFDLGYKHDMRSVFAANCAIVQPTEPEWEL